MSFFKTANYDIPELNLDIFRLVKDNSRVLDVGCASGKLAEKLKKEKHCFVMGIESNQELAKRARARCDKVLGEDISKLEKLPVEKNFFDCIIFADILEHLVDPDGVLIKFKQYLSDQGYILLSVPNIANWEIRLRLLFGNFDYNDPLIDGGHIRFFNLASIKRLLRECGYRVVYLTNRNARIKFLGKIFKSLFAFQFIIKAEKIP